MTKIVVTGTGKSGSWQIRGEQLGRAIGASVLPRLAQPTDADIVIVVKRPLVDAVALARRAKALVVYDVVDGWPQPLGNWWKRDEAMRWLRDRLALLKPDAIVVANALMAGDCREVSSKPVIVVPHHARPGLLLNPIRRMVSVIGYEGAEHYIASVRPSIERWCVKHGRQFVVNPKSLADLDIVLALREQQGYPGRNWKSQVKLANAQGSGTPCIVDRERSYMEFASGGEEWADTETELVQALDALEAHEVRQSKSAALLRAAPHLRDVAHAYREWLIGLRQ